jgi:tetratricopeptide (TPR) repeat protein
MFTPRLQNQAKDVQSKDASTGGKSGAAAVLKNIKQLVSERNFDKAKEVLAQNIEQDPGNATFLLVMSKLLTISKDYPKAAIYVERAIKADPLNTAALLQQGTIRFKQSDLNGAIESVQGALNLDAKSIKAFHLQQRIYRKNSQHNQLIASCDNCILLYPSDARSYLNKSAVLSIQKQYQEAEDLINSAIQMVPESSSLYAELGNIYDMQGLHSKALLAYQKSIADQKSPRPTIYLKLAKSFLGLSDYSQCRQALDDYNSVLRNMSSKSMSSRVKNRYQYTYDFVYASSLKDQSNPHPYQTSVSAILRRMLIDSPNLHGELGESMSSDALSTLSFERIEELVITGVKSFEANVKDGDSSSDMSDDELGAF